MAIPGRTKKCNTFRPILLARSRCRAYRGPALRPPIHVPVSRVLQFGGGTSRTHRDVSVAGLRRLSRVVDSADRDTCREETRAPGQTSRTFLNLVGSFGARTASNRQSSLTGFGRL